MKKHHITAVLVAIIVLGLFLYYGLPAGAKFEKMPHGSGAVYNISIESDWGSGADPNFLAPARTGKGVGMGPHTGNFFFITHNGKYNLFTPGKLARPGISKTSMFGTIDMLKKNANNYYDIETAPPVALPTTVSAIIKADELHPLFSFSAMAAPSPDWFFGISDINLRPNGRWLPGVTMNVLAYDAGTDSGTKFQNMPDYPTRPPQPVKVLGQPMWRGKPGRFAKLILTRVR